MGNGASSTKNILCHRKMTSSMNKSERVLRAVVLIQRWYRRYWARMEIRRRCTWTIFQSLEYAEEQDQLKLYNFFIEMINHLQQLGEPSDKIAAHVHGSQKTQDLSSDYLQLLKDTNPLHIKIENNYKGPNITFPLSKADFEALIDGFRKKKVLHAKYALQLLHEARLMLKTKSNINRASTILAHQITICGDLHGKLDDLFVIFHKNGLPCAENPYVFNGDFVDRGRNSVEVLLLLLAAFIAFPNSVYLNRGNHEDSVMNMRYGFTNEILTKYKHQATKLILLIEDIFGWLPLATIIDQKILVVHGGISDSTNLMQLETIDRHQFISLLKPPVNSQRPEDWIENGALDRNASSWEWKMVLDLLWSDPMRADGCEPNLFRGGGVYFGPDVTRRVLDKHKLELLVRSHECKSEGYQFVHGNKCLTIFSASDYYDIGSNRGAYVKLSGKELRPHFVQYTTPRIRKLTIKQRVGIVERSALANLKSTVSASKSLLFADFQKLDPRGTGLIQVGEWCHVMTKVLGLDLPWRILKDRLVQVDDTTGLVFYASTCDDVTLNKLQPDDKSPSIVETLYRHKNSLETIFRIIDKDNSGSISVKQFQDACALLSQHLGKSLPDNQLQEIALIIDINKDGFIDINEFLEAFRLVDTRHGKK